MMNYLLRQSQATGKYRVFGAQPRKMSRFLCAFAFTTLNTTTAFSATHIQIATSQRKKRVALPSSWISCRSASSQTDYDSAMTLDEKEMTVDALSIIQEAIFAVDPKTAVQAFVNVDASSGSLKFGPSLTFHAQDYDEVVVIAFGKASSAMAKATAERVQKAFPKIPMSGIAIVKDDHATANEIEYLEICNIQVREASHPIPDERGFSAAKDIMKKVASATDRTLVVCCISGGGSSLFCHPKAEYLTLDDLQTTNRYLQASGMTIQEINVIRKRLEDGKGGRLAAVAYPGTVATLVLSDVLGDSLDLIASGPTVPDSSTWDDAWQLVQKFGLEGGNFCLPDNVLRLLKAGLAGNLEDSPSRNHPAFSTAGGSKVILVGNNELAVMAAANESKRRGYNPVVLGTMIEGEAQEAARMYTAMAQHLASQRTIATGDDGGVSIPYTMACLPVALIGGGETTVTLSVNPGKGGRNQELALAAALQLKSLSLRNVVLASAGTDGTDGPTDAAGAVVDGGTVDRSPLLAKEYLKNHDAYNFFNESGHRGPPLIITGPTGTNVADVCVTLIR